MIKIVVDLLGADKPQTELVSGAIRAISENKDLYVYLMGRKAELEDFLANVNYDESQLEIVDCTQEITNYEDSVSGFSLAVAGAEFNVAVAGETSGTVRHIISD